MALGGGEGACVASRKAGQLGLFDQGLLLKAAVRRAHSYTAAAPGTLAQLINRSCANAATHQRLRLVGRLSQGAAALSYMLTLTLTPHPISTLTPAPVGTA
jgi:hypothetical protein